MIKNKNKINVEIIPKIFQTKMNINKFCSGDIEADLNNNNEFEFKLGVIFDRNIFINFDNIHKMFDYIISNKKTVYFHNLDFDFLFFMRTCVMPVNTEIINSGNMIIKIKFPNGACLLNSLTLFPMSLKNIVKKYLKFDFIEWFNQKENIFGLSDEECLMYCQRDTYLLHSALNNFFVVLKVNYNINSGLTLPSIAKSVFDKKYLKYDIYKRENVKNFFNSDYYFGGHTEKFVEKKYFFDNLNYYDFNSLYPYIMKVTDFPISEPIFITPSFPKLLELLTTDKLFFVQLTVDVIHEDLRFLVSNDGLKNNYFFGKRVYKLSRETIEFIIEIGYFDCLSDIKTLIYYNNKAKIFEDYIIDTYNYRKSDPKNDLIYKYLLNGLYGKFGQNKELEKMTINPFKMSEDVNKITIINDNLLSVEDDCIKGKALLSLRKDISGLITENSRLLMAKTRYKFRINGIRLIYQDTDSFIVEADLRDFKDFDNILCSRTLGKLKKENDSPLSGVIIGQKIYALHDKKNNKYFIASKGVKNFTFEDGLMLGSYMQKIKLKYSDKKILNSHYFIRMYIPPKNNYYNTRFTKIKTLMQKNFHGITIVPHEINNIRERLDK